MANVLTDLAADIYQAADIVGRELVGVIPSATINTSATERAAQGDVIRAAYTREQSVTAVTPSMTIPEGADQTVDNQTMTLNSTASVKIPWTGEDIKHVNNGAGFNTIYGDQIKQAMRAITNQIEGQVATDIGDRASRAVGTAGTTPFATNFDTVAEVRQVLVDNGMPSNDRLVTLVMNSAAGTKLRNLASLNGVNTSGNDELLRRGTLLDLQGLMMKESAGIDSHTAGTGGSATTNDAGYAVGATTITLASAGTGTILAGDVVTFAGDTNQYVVTTGDGDVSGGGTIVLGAPGLQVAIAGSATAITVVASSAKNVAFHKSAVEIGVRGLAQPAGGDAAVDRLTVQDPMSGLIYDVAAYKGYNKAMFDVSVLYGFKVWKPEFTAVLLG
tara:strand:- start:2177 stop:3340 length:1164 start_codon:yes stop_codon:yes gene_type:complete